MGFLDRLFGRNTEPAPQQPPRQRNQTGSGQWSQDPDERAVQRYLYLLRTAPPETIEQAHAEAFAQLTPEQRRQVLQQLSATLPENERATTRLSDDPQSLARMATRAEMRQPGTLERTFSGGQAGGMGGGIGLGGLMAGSFLSTIAGVMVGSMIADAFFNDQGMGDGGYDQGMDGADAGQDMSGADMGDSGGSIGGDYGGEVAGDFGGGDFGGDFGGGDF